MRLLKGILLLITATAVSAASWSFEAGSITVASKGASEANFKDQLHPSKPLSKPVTLSSADTLNILLTATNGKKPRKPHQCFLTLTDEATGLEESYPIPVKENGKAKLDLTTNNIPAQLLVSPSSLKASLVIASFGASTPYKDHAFDLTIAFDPTTPPPSIEKPLRYGALPEIHHIFRTDPRSPPKIVTLIFFVAVFACVPGIFIFWGMLGANLDHLGKAMQAAPISYTLFFGSIVAMEGVFFMYYTSWNLFQTLPIAGALAVIAFVSGTKALREVQQRRLDGKR